MLDFVEAFGCLQPSDMGLVEETVPADPSGNYQPAGKEIDVSCSPVLRNVLSVKPEFQGAEVQRSS